MRLLFFRLKNLTLNTMTTITVVQIRILSIIVLLPSVGRVVQFSVTAPKWGF